VVQAAGKLRRASVSSLPRRLRVLVDMHAGGFTNSQRRSLAVRTTVDAALVNVPVPSPMMKNNPFCCIPRQL